MIDVHVIKSNRGYFNECIESLKDDPIDVHILKHSDENYGLLRAEGFLKGKHEYAAAIDDDDILIQGIFNTALKQMQTGKFTAYYSNHYIMNSNKKVYGKRFNKLASEIGFSQSIQMHHVVVYKKSIIEPVLKYLEGIKIFDKTLLNLKSIYDGKVKGDNNFGLYWRVHDKCIHKKPNKSFKNNPIKWQDKVDEYKRMILEKDAHII